MHGNSHIFIKYAQENFKAISKRIELEGIIFKSIEEKIFNKKQTKQKASVKSLFKRKGKKRLKSTEKTMVDLSSNTLVIIINVFAQNS